MYNTYNFKKTDCGISIKKKLKILDF